MILEEIRDQVEAWRRAGQRYAEALVTRVWRSAPSGPGARFLYSEDGEIAGNVSAGCVEADLAERLSALLEGRGSALVEYDVSDEEAAGVGLACGGRIRLHLATWDPTGTVWPTLVERTESRETSLLLTHTSGLLSTRWLLAEDGTILARDGDGTPPAAAASTALELSGSRSGEFVSVSESAGGPVVVELLRPGLRLVVVGGTPVGTALSRVAVALGIPTTLVEPRPGYLREAQPGCGTVAAWPGEALREIAPDAATAVAVVAHDERVDLEALSTLSALSGSGAGYVGLLGGGRTREKRFAALREAGVTDAWISEVHAPIGLDIGAESAGEIAVAILAEVIETMRVR